MGHKRLVWIDAQLPPSLAQWLRSEYGTDAMHVEALGLHRAHDSEIFTAARAAQDSVVIVTKDDDFAKLLDQHGPPPQVLWVRCGNVNNQELRRIVLDAWPRASALLTASEALVEIRRQS
jgi:predicted nuclease of predicted toxin-antitoxin system